MLTIVMYHYVRDLATSRFPRIKGRARDEFRSQLDYIARHFTVVTMEEVLAAATAGAALPAHAALLTFDDGLRDHHDHVLPLLAERQWQGSFFPPVDPVRERRVLDTHKIHFILASVPQPDSIVERIMAAIDIAREPGAPDAATWWARLAQPSRFDSAEVIFIKRALQRDLPAALRARITDELFREYVSADEREFADELYLSVAQLRALRDAGMFVGAHGASHTWLTHVAPEQRQREITASLELLAQVGAETWHWVMCYPFGAWDAPLCAQLRENGCVLGLTTEVGVADLNRHDPLTLPRLDTNDLPTSAAAAQQA